MKKKIYLHIGYGKAASTFLQTLFVSCNKINPIFLRNQNKDSLNILKKINYFKKKHNPELINIISDEGLTSPFSKKNLDIYKGLPLIFDILKSHYDLKVLLFVRSQHSWFISRYSQNPLRLIDVNKKFYSYNNFIKIFDKKINSFKIENFKRNVNYNLMYNFLTREIGKKNVKFLIFEELVNNPNKVLSELEKFFNKGKIFFDLSKTKQNKYQTFKIKSFYLPKINLLKVNFLIKKYGFLMMLKIFFFNFIYLPSKKTNSWKIKKSYKNSNILFSKKIKKNLEKLNYF